MFRKKEDARKSQGKELMGGKRREKGKKRKPGEKQGLLAKRTRKLSTDQFGEYEGMIE